MQENGQRNKKRGPCPQGLATKEIVEQRKIRKTTLVRTDAAVIFKFPPEK
jgi:hypothetical protein